MIIVIVRFPVPPAMSNEAVAAAYEASAPSYQTVPGLLRKQYLLGHVDEQTRAGGAVYLWESREAADALYTEAWRQKIAARWGADPHVEYFDNLLTVDPESIAKGQL